MKDFEEFLSLVRKRTEQRKKAEVSGQPLLDTLLELKAQDEALKGAAVRP